METINGVTVTNAIGTCYAWATHTMVDATCKNVSYRRTYWRWLDILAPAFKHHATRYDRNESLSVRFSLRHDVSIWPGAMRMWCMACSAGLHCVRTLINAIRSSATKFHAFWIRISHKHTVSYHLSRLKTYNLSSVRDNARLLSKYICLILCYRANAIGTKRIIWRIW